MKTSDIQTAINQKKMIYFCEGRNGINQVVEGIPVAMYVSEQSVIVGVFIPNGIRVATVDAVLVGADAFEAQKAVSQKNQVIAAVLEKCWAFSVNQISGVKEARVVTPGVTGGEEVN